MFAFRLRRGELCKQRGQGYGTAVGCGIQIGECGGGACYGGRPRHVTALFVCLLRLALCSFCEIAINSGGIVGRGSQLTPCQQGLRGVTFESGFALRLESSLRAG